MFMPISSLSRLKKHPVVIELNRKQSEYDNKDDAILDSPFTRSPLHAIQFLIVYAGLDDDQKTCVLSKLQANILKKDIDCLVNEINWSRLLLPSNTGSTIGFTCTVGVAKTATFLNAIKSNCPQLHQAIMHDDCIVTIQETDKIVIKTKLDQNESWQKAFDREPGSKHWDVPEYKLSEALLEKIKSLPQGHIEQLGAFKIIKGRGDAAKTIELQITAPAYANKFHIQSNIAVNPGIYASFIGLPDFYGLQRVDDVTVELDSNAQFSDKGASASQTQITTMQLVCDVWYSEEPTIVKVRDLNVWFNGIDIVACFGNKVKRSQDFDSTMYIEIPTKSQEDTKITLLAKSPMPMDAFSLTRGTKQAESSVSISINSLFPQANSSATKQKDTSVGCKIM